ncbi:hypothetical protein Hanom_Chr04g00372291 [Helianthus anomalus]
MKSSTKFELLLSIDIIYIELKDTRKFFCKEFKDTRKLRSNDEPFHLSWSQTCKIIAMIRSRKTPTPKTYTRWGEYAISFYLKMCTCFGVDYQHLEATNSRGNKSLSPETSLKEHEEHMGCSGVNQLLTTNMSYEERVYQTGLDDNTSLSPKELMDVMSIIHSRKTPTFWEMCWQEIIFYCKLCSCFGIDYHCLEAASEDDVCLMNMGRNG